MNFRIAEKYSPSAVNHDLSLSWPARDFYQPYQPLTTHCLISPGSRGLTKYLASFPARPHESKLAADVAAFAGGH
jgi:hypothetical protein